MKATLLANAKLQVALYKAEVIEALICGGWSGNSMDPNTPKVKAAFGESRRGSFEIEYTDDATCLLVCDGETNESGWATRFVVCYQPGHKYGQVYLCDYEVDGDHHYYSPLYLIGHVSPQ
jgi:hypothetical protein